VRADRCTGWDFQSVYRSMTAAKAPAFVFLESSSRAAVTDVSDPRFW